MAFLSNNMSPCFAGNGGLVKTWNYTTTDSLATILAAGYFNAEAATLGIGDTIEVSIVDAVPIGSRTVVTESLSLTIFSNNGTTVTSRLWSGTKNQVVMLDDFEGPTLTNWAHPTKGSDAATADFAILADVNGKLRGTTGANVGVSMATNGIMLYRALNWKANQGGLAMEARIQTSAITTISYFVGFTNQVTTLTAPIISAASADTFTNNAADAVGFMFDTAMATKNLWLTGVAASVGATNQNSGIAPVAATYITLRVELTTAGVATFYINNVLAGTALAGAVTPTVALTPTVSVFTRAAASATMDIDYVTVQALRV